MEKRAFMQQRPINEPDTGKFDAKHRSSTRLIFVLSVSLW